MNIVLIIIIFLLAWKVCSGYKNGMVREAISFISLIIMAVVAILLSNGLKSYMNKEVINFIAILLMLCIIGIAHHVLGFVFFSAKLISKLPIIHSVDKLVGIVFGVLETVIILWILYSLINLFNIGTIGQQIIDTTMGNKILTWIYEHNMLLNFVKGLK